MASIKVKFRPSIGVRKEGSIYYQVIHERKTRQIPTKYRIYPWEWNEKRACISCSENSARIPYLLSVKESIRVDIERIGKVIRNLDKTRFDYSSDDIVEEYERIIEENSLFRFMEATIVKLKLNGRLRTSETYRAALNSFRKYRNGEDIMLESVSRDEMQAYESWLRHNGKAPNTVSFYIRILRAVYNRAVEEGLTDNRWPFRKVYTGIEKTVKRALPIEIIKKIRNMNLKSDPEIEYARDIFILSFMLRGMSLIDMAFLKKEDLSNGYITYRRRKTGQQLVIEWTDDMQSIVDKYPSFGTEYLLPIIQNPNANAVYAYRNMGYTINRHLHEIAERLEISMPLTMYVARHSWASAAKAKGIPLGIISECMGHDSELTTQIYLASLDTSAAHHANAVLLQELAQ